MGGRGVEAGEREHAQSVGGHRFDFPAYGVAIEGSASPVGAQGLVTAFEQALDGADLVDDASGSVAAVERGAEHVLRLEGDHVEQRCLLDRLGVDEPGLGGGHEEGGLGGVALHLVPPVFEDELGIVAEQAGTEAFEQGRVFAGVDRLSLEADLAFGIVTAPGDLVAAAPGTNGEDRHLILGQGAGLVRADDGGAAEGFHGGQLADDGATVRHAGDADGEHDGERRGQSFGNGADGEGDGRHEHVDRRFAASHAHGEGEGGEAEDHPEEQLAELGDLAGERGGDLHRLGDEPGDAAGLGAVAGGPDQPFGLTGGDQGAGVGLVSPVGEGDVVVEGIGVLGNRERLAGEGRFVAMEVVDVEEAEIGRHAVAGLEQDHVAGNELRGGHAKLASSATHDGLGGDHATEGFDGLFRPAFLDEADDRVDQDHAEDDAGIDPLGQGRSDAHGGEEDVDQGLVELEEQAFPGGRSAATGDDIGTEALQPFPGFLGRKAVTQVAVEQAGRLRRLQVVPAGFFGREDRLPSFHAAFSLPPVEARSRRTGASGDRFRQQIHDFVAVVVDVGRVGLALHVQPDLQDADAIRRWAQQRTRSFSAEIATRFSPSHTTRELTSFATNLPTTSSTKAYREIAWTPPSLVFRSLIRFM